MDNPFGFNGQLPQDDYAFGRFNVPENNNAWPQVQNPFESPSGLRPTLVSDARPSLSPFSAPPQGWDYQDANLAGPRFQIPKGMPGAGQILEMPEKFFTWLKGLTGELRTGLPKAEYDARLQKGIQEHVQSPSALSYPQAAEPKSSSLADENGLMRWTQEADGLLANRIKQGKNYQEIGEEFNASPDAIKNRAFILRQNNPEYGLEKRLPGQSKNAEGIRANPNYTQRVEVAERRWREENNYPQDKELPENIKSAIDSRVYTNVYMSWQKAFQNGRATENPARYFEMGMNKPYNRSPKEITKPEKDLTFEEEDAIAQAKYRWWMDPNNNPWLRSEYYKAGQDYNAHRAATSRHEVVARNSFGLERNFEKQKNNYVLTEENIAAMKDMMPGAYAAKRAQGRPDGRFQDNPHYQVMTEVERLKAARDGTSADDLAKIIASKRASFYSRYKTADARSTELPLPKYLDEFNKLKSEYEQLTGKPYELPKTSAGVAEVPEDVPEQWFPRGWTTTKGNEFKEGFKKQLEEATATLGRPPTPQEEELIFRRFSQKNNPRYRQFSTIGELTVRDSPHFKQDIQAWSEANGGVEPPTKVIRSIYARTLKRYQKARENSGQDIPFDQEAPPTREYKRKYAEGGEVEYADGGATPFDLGAIEIKDAQSPFDLGAKLVDEDWRGYPKVIGSGIAQGAITGLGKTLQGIPELYADNPEDSALARAGRSIEQYGKEQFPLTPSEERSLTGQIAKGVGTVAPVIAGGAATPALGAARGIAGLGATIAGAGQMGAMSAAEQAQRARSSGATPETTRQAALTGFGINTALGFIPFHEFLKPIARSSPGLQSWAIAKLKGAAESGVVFGGIGEAQKFLGEEIAKNFYDPKAEYKPEIQEAIVNFLTGATLGAVRRAPEPTERVREAGTELPPEARPRVEEPTTNLDRLLEGERLRGAQEIASRPIERAPQMDTLFPERTQQTTQTDTLFPKTEEIKSEVKSESAPIQMVRPTDIKIDPRYQFRTSDENGLTKAPTQAKIEAFDPAKANPILAHETTDGNINVVNGFHRTELARQAQLAAGQSDLQIAARVLKESEGHSPAFMKQLGVYQNLAEGTGGLEAARILKTNPQGIADRLNEMPAAGKLVQDAKALASLSPEGFGLVSRGNIPPAFAAEVSRLVREQADQLRSLEAISRAKPENINQVRDIVRSIDPMAIERQQVLDRAIETLKKSTAENQAERANNERLAEVLQTTAARQGEISKALDNAAKQLSDGRHINSIAPSLVSKLKSIPRGKLERLQQSSPLYGGRPTGEAEPLPALSPKASSQRKQMEKILGDLIQKQIGKHVQVKFQSKIPQEGLAGYGGKFAGEKSVAGLYRPAEKIIQVAMADPRYPDLLRTALHEPFHAVQDLLATPAELKILKREDGRLREIVAKELELSPQEAKNISTSEVQAAAYDAWARGKFRGEKLPPPLTRLYNNIKEFLRKVSNAIRGLGFKSADDVFSSVLKGEMANRPAREPGRFVSEAAGVSAFPEVTPPPTSVPSIKPTPPTDTLGPFAKKIANAIDKMGLGDVVRDIQIKATPMAARDATIESRAAAKDFANGIQEARYTQTSLDDLLTKNFTPEQQKRMWEAADAESVSLQTGKPTNKGLNTLTTKERQFVERMQKRADEVFDEAKKLGIYEGGDEGLPSYVTRLVLMKKADGTYERPSYGKHVRSLDSIGGKLRTTTPQMIERKYLTVEETESAAKAALGEGAEVLKNIRVLPYATGLLQEAVAGRQLINRIKEAGKEAGADTVAEGKKPEGNWFTIDHPAFYNTYTDAKGALHKTPIYVRSDFEGPLRSVLEQGNGGKIYRALMDLKGKTMSVIMMSPMIHNQVEWGRALPAMPGKVLTGRIYFEGNRAKNDPDVMREAIRGGLVPIGHRGYMQDISSVPEMPNLAPGRSFTAKVLAAVPGLFSKTAGDSVKRTVDKLGDFWHNTLLWDRIGDLQMGLYTNLRDNLIKKGFEPLTAQRAAAHWANRYAGAIPLEAMSSSARKIANIVMFSRSFTLGNLGVVKDSYSGLPRDVQAQIARDSGMEELAKIKSVARRKATAVVMIDIALFYVMNSVLQSAMNTMGAGQTAATIGGAIAGGALGGLAGPLGSLAGAGAGGYAGFNAVNSTGDRTLEQEIESYKKRFADIQKHSKEHPLEVLNPFSPYKGAEMLSATSENEPNKHDRVLVGYQKDGTAIYARLPTGKIGEEFMGYQTSPLDMMHRKMGTWMRPLSEIWANDKGFGRKIYDKDADQTTGEQVKNIGRVMWHLLSSQLPVDWAQSISDLETGQGDKTTNLLKSVGPILGMTFSKGAPTGPVMGEVYRKEEKQRFEFGQQRDNIRRLIEAGKTDEAIQIMDDLHIDPKLMKYYVEIYSGGNRLSGRKAKNFMRGATEQEAERFNRLLERQGGQTQSPASPFDLGATPRP